jgi:RNA recognition motif-containing protein
MFSWTFRGFGKLVLKNISYRASTENITELVSRYGKVTDVKLLKTPEGVSRGLAFVELDPAENTEDVISQLNDQDYMGRRLM